MSSHEKVYLLYHWRDENEDATAKLIGVFSSSEAAEGAKCTLLSKPGFRDFPNAFVLDEYLVDRVNWGEGFSSADTGMREAS